ncbi:MAG: acyl--CoA ligase, partial [Actinobacteria bacterium]|nr:acyl--CoA ligase [Actinomycetota bacterium]
VRANPDGLATTLGDQGRTFAELDAAGNRVARALARLGVAPGDIVAWWSDPSLRTLDVFVGAARAGAVLAPLNPQLPEAEVARIIGYLEPRLLVTDAAHAEAATVLGDVPLAVVGADGRPAPGRDFDADCAAAAPARPDVAVDDRTPHIVYLTSGSTGRPKGALVSHRASWLRAAPGGGTFTEALRGPGGIVTAFPLYHYGGWHYVIEAWQNRRPYHQVRRATADELLDAVERWRPSALYAIPAVWERILDAPTGPADLSSLRHADTGTSHASAGLLERIRARVPGATTTVLYGSTEVGRMAALHDTEIAARPGSVGRAAAPGVLWLDEATGEVCASSPTMMDGYLRLPDETARALRDGVYHSGDVGEFDADGYLYLTGRLKELIRTGGESVWPVEVEQALRGLPGVRDLAVIGVPDDRWGEVVCAAVVVADGAPAPDVAAVAAHLDGRLARFKQPR